LAHTASAVAVFRTARRSCCWSWAHRLTTNAASVDPATLSGSGVVDYNRDYSLVAKLADWGIRMHIAGLKAKPHLRCLPAHMPIEVHRLVGARTYTRPARETSE